tara:strand:- start:43 stop:603 length:561 start_codon:yes stop_codon:yes gene_type:complete
MIDDILVFDNIIDSKSQKEIQDIVFNKVKWTFVADVTNPQKNQQQRPGFLYNYMKENIVYKYHNDMIKILDAACNKINFKRNDCLQGRSFLQLPLNLKDRRLDAPHIDANKDHLVILYYVNDSDGDTVIYKNKFISEDKTPKFDELEEWKRVTPKSGRVVMFNGKHWHTAQQPEHNVRCIINYNVV